MYSFFKVFQFIMILLLYLTLAVRSIMIVNFEGINPFVIGKGKIGFQKISEYLFFLGLLIWTYEVVARIFDLGFHILPDIFFESLINSNLFLNLAGTLLITIGFCIFILSLLAFGNSWRIGIDKDHPGKLVMNGIFMKSRNPIFLFLDLYFIATALMNLTPFFIAFALIVLLGLHYQILQEESFLEELYGKDYLFYKTKVRRYF